MVVPSLNRPRQGKQIDAPQGRPTMNQAAWPLNPPICHFIDPHHKETQVQSNPTARPSIQCIQRPKMNQVTDPQHQQSEGRAM
ncbi:hypothetical protein U9M48_003220 [Paspalum notatum var. saurae]|uniref:Uncharacterized protein n=1 Tax=Paspalum notatum var. saurae TaxID=547442 RepID=A0AAQ3PSH2_PASNO